MSRFLLLWSLFLLASCFGNREKPDCGSFKEGKFLLRDNYSRTKYIIERKPGVQTELNENTDTIKTYRVKWLNECEYELTAISAMKKTISHPSEDQGEVKYRDDIPVKVTIIEIADRYYIFEIKNTALKRVYSDTIWKLNR